MTQAATLEKAQIDDFVERVARKLLDRRLEVPAIFFLEAHLPFAAFAQTLGLLLEPFALPLFGADRIAEFRLFLSDRANIEQLIARLERGVKEREALSEEAR